jgi:lysophospholipase L1-like esterase
MITVFSFRSVSTHLGILTSLLFLTLSPGTAAEKVYTPVEIPPGMSAAAVPTPRQEWFQRVQEKFDKTQGRQFDLVFDGDSIIAGWEWPERGLPVWTQRYAKFNPANFGIAGDMVQNLLWRLQQGELTGVDPKLIVLMTGTNNLQWDTAENIGDGIKVLVGEYLKAAPRAHLLLLGILPRGGTDDPIRAKITSINTMLSGLADGKRVSYLDLAPSFLSGDGSEIVGLFGPDSVHPTPKGYEVWADAMQPEIDKILPPKP